MNEFLNTQRGKLKPYAEHPAALRIEIFSLCVKLVTIHPGYQHTQPAISGGVDLFLNKVF
jgi:hypothetical protein